MPASTLSPESTLARAAEAHGAGDHQGALRLLASLKALRRPIPGVDRLRAACFAAIGDAASAEQARREEARWFPASGATAAVGQGLLHERDESRWIDLALEAVGRYTMLSEQRLRSLHAMARSCGAESIEGAFVECGVAAGGSSALLAGCARRLGSSRRVWCFDTFTGMPEPGPEDRARNGVTAEESGWGTGTCSAPEASVLEAASLFGAADRIVIRKGLFQETLPIAAAEIGPIALLHLDGDWYDSTRVCLECLWHRVVPGGHIQVDDYGHWEGCRRAVDEFLASQSKVTGLSVSIERIDYTGVRMRKPSSCGGGAA
jgi:Macrocin-O-methyltransferase (TylF)